jgi:hypothetical protein
VLGTGRTALKASVSRYLKQEYATLPNSVNPVGASTDTRNWTDRNNDRIPQLDELGPSTNLNFGRPTVVTMPTDDVRLGWQKRGYNVEYAVALQQQLLPGLGANVGYYRRAYGNLTWTDNTLVDQSDYAPFTIKNPINGETITMYNLSAAKRGQSLNVIRFAPDDATVFNGVDVTIAGKFGKGGTVNGGVSTGRIAQSRCTTDDPNRLLFCDYAPGFLKQNQYKVVFVMPAIYGIRTSGSFQNVPGIIFGPSGFDAPGVLANYTVTSAIAGLTLTNGSITIPLLKPGEEFGERKTQVDFRVSRTFQTGNWRIDPFIDFYNMFNASTVTAENTTYGPLWRNATDALIGRVVQVGMTIKF